MAERIEIIWTLLELNPQRLITKFCKQHYPLRRGLLGNNYLMLFQILFFSQTVPIKLALPQAAQQSIF